MTSWRVVGGLQIGLFTRMRP